MILLTIRRVPKVYVCKCTSYFKSLQVLLSAAVLFFFFFNDTATTEIYTLSLTRRSSDLHLHAQQLQLGHALARLVHIAHDRSEEHTSELQSHSDLVCRLLLEKKKQPGRSRPVT